MPCTWQQRRPEQRAAGAASAPLTTQTRQVGGCRIGGGRGFSRGDADAREGKRGRRTGAGMQVGIGLDVSTVVPVGWQVVGIG